MIDQRADARDDHHRPADVDDLERDALERVRGVAAVRAVDAARASSARMHAPTGGWRAPGDVAHATIAAPARRPAAAPTTTIAAAATGAPGAQDQRLAAAVDDPRERRVRQRRRASAYAAGREAAVA